MIFLLRNSVFTSASLHFLLYILSTLYTPLGFKFIKKIFFMNKGGLFVSNDKKIGNAAVDNVINSEFTIHTGDGYISRADTCIIIPFSLFW